MARGSAAEVVTGAAVLVLTLGFLGYAVAHTGSGGGGGYDLQAKFDHIDGLSVGSDVRIGGVKVGSVTAAALDPRTYQAVVSLSVRDDVGVPADSSAVVTSDGLLGGKYLAIQPGGDTAMLPHGGTITVTQGSISLEDLLGKFIFSMSDAKKPAAAPTPAAPAKPGP
jgi:phospholipid/cholesterol/gamma-HCH transport system substrate-binding protein